MMLVEVPTRVTRPPSREAVAIGISSREVAVPVLRDSCWAIGIRIAKAPTFLVAIDRTAVAAVRTGTWVRSLFNRESTGRITSSTMPLRAKAELTTRAAAMITTTSLLKPSKACWAGTTPTNTAVSSAPIETRS